MWMWMKKIIDVISFEFMVVGRRITISGVPFLGLLFLEFALHIIHTTNKLHIKKKLIYFHSSLY